MKIISFKAYGIAGGEMVVNVSQVTGGEVVTTQFTDYGDGTERSCISVEMPIEAETFGTDSTSQPITFLAGQVQVIDFYVELM